MVMVYNIGMTVLIMKVNGAITKQKDKVLFGTLKAMSIKVNSETIWQMAMVSTLISMVLNTREN